MFLTWNRNKRSICVDMRKPEGIALIKRLVKDADVFMENYRPGVADDMGLGWAELQSINPRLVYCSTNAWGSVGPWRDYPGTDPVVQAASGVMSVTGERDGGPVMVGIPIADYCAAMLTVQAVLLGICARNATRLGQHIELSMLGSLLFGLTTRVGPYFATGENPVRWGRSHSQVVPNQTFKTKDGYASMAVLLNENWAPFCEALGHPELANDERFDTNPKRVERRDELDAILNRIIETRSTAEWGERMHARQILFAPVHSFSEILNHPQTEANGFVIDVEHPTVGPFKQIGPVIKMSDTPGSIRMAPPRLGEHTSEVLNEFGWSVEEIQELEQCGVILKEARRGDSQQRSSTIGTPK
jgi:formyl-CoA transferase/CoA:oxalate CoA-transferase